MDDKYIPPNPAALRAAAALQIQGGASNPIAIANEILRHSQVAIRARQPFDPRTDPAIRLMVHQLSFLCGSSEVNDRPNVYADLVEACEREIGMPAATAAEEPERKGMRP